MAITIICIKQQPVLQPSGMFFKGMAGFLDMA